ncbi:MAG: DNA primase [Bacteroidales bacterium]|nr:DNA primase [Bacteroidales bacterium]
MISKKTIDEIMFATKIEDVVGDFVTLKRQGQGFVGVCPFHNDKNPSMHVTPRLGIYKCFVCDAKGNAIHFLMEHAKMTYPEALEYLAKKYSITIEYDREETEEEKNLRSEKESLFLVNEFAEKYFMDQLRNSEEGKMLGLSYFKERGFKDATMDKFHLGYCPGGWDSFTKEALKQGYKEEFLLKLGLTKKSESGKLYDFYRGRVIFPIHNTVGKTIGFGGRILKKDDKIAKYFNSPENEIYHKSDTLYDLYLAKKAIRQKDNIYLVEGYTDVISMFESGVENVIASSGTSLTDGQVKMIFALTRNITVLYDGDAAGIKASLRGIDMLLEKGMNVRVCLLPDGEDPDSFAKKHRDSELQDYLTNNTTDFILFKAQILSEEAGKDPIKRANVVNSILESIAKVQEPITQSFYIKECARIFELPENTLGSKIRSIIWKTNTDKKKAGQDSNVQMPVLQDVQIQEQRKAEQQLRPQTNLLYEAEKDLVLLLLKYGLYEITTDRNVEEGIVTKQRIDQYIVNDLYNDGIVLQDNTLRKVYEHYGRIAEILNDKDEIQRTFLFSEDKDEYQFAIDNLSNETYQYSPQWEKKLDMLTRFADNNIHNLQQVVADTLLALKLRIVEQQIAFLTNEMKSGNYNEEETIGLITHINQLNKCRKTIAEGLNRVISK